MPGVRRGRSDCHRGRLRRVGCSSGGCRGGTRPVMRMIWIVMRVMMKEGSNLGRISPPEFPVVLPQYLLLVRRGSGVRSGCRRGSRARPGRSRERSVSGALSDSVRSSWRHAVRWGRVGVLRRRRQLRVSGGRSRGILRRRRRHSRVLTGGAAVPRIRRVVRRNLSLGAGCWSGGGGRGAGPRSSSALFRRRGPDEVMRRPHHRGGRGGSSRPAGCHRRRGLACRISHGTRLRRHGVMPHQEGRHAPDGARTHRP
mmetsp:Transcript_60643/g.179826  ORF Transcript_60643/g.179826 Transcript_60643/m.179826 type:complete len:255 (-) Transcript_60643:557-1321(-)